MRVAFVFLAIFFAFVANQSLVPINEDDEFDYFVARYNRIYPNAVEKENRKQEFKKNMKMIEKNNKDFAKGLVKYELKMNLMTDFYRDERLKMSNGNRIPTSEFTVDMLRGRSIAYITLSTFPPGPPSVDWRPCVTPVVDQGYYCNNCWAFSAIAALESHWCIKTGELNKLSEQQLIDCNRNDETGSWGCNGGNQASAYMYVYGNGGIQTDPTYPYQEAVQHSDIYPCRSQQLNNSATTTGYMRIASKNVTEAEIILKNTIAARGPVAAAVYGSLDTFYFYYRGIYDDKNCPTGKSHSVTIVGYGTDNGIVSRTRQSRFCDCQHR